MQPGRHPALASVDARQRLAIRSRSPESRNDQGSSPHQWSLLDPTSASAAASAGWEARTPRRCEARRHTVMPDRRSRRDPDQSAHIDYLTRVWLPRRFGDLAALAGRRVADDAVSLADNLLLESCATVAAVAPLQGVFDRVRVPWGDLVALSAAVGLLAMDPAEHPPVVSSRPAVFVVLQSQRCRSARCGAMKRSSCGRPNAAVRSIRSKADLDAARPLEDHFCVSNYRVKSTSADFLRTRAV